jgi:hypothetical protein
VPEFGSTPAAFVSNTIASKEKSKEGCGDISDELRLQSQIRLFSEKNLPHIPA